MRFYNEIDAVLGCRSLQAERTQDRTFVNVVVKEEEGEEKLQKAAPQTSSATENIAVCCAPPAATISRNEEEDEVQPEPQSAAGGVTETEALAEEEKISTSSEDAGTTSRKRTSPEKDCSVPKKRMKVKHGTMFQRHVGTIINTFMDYQTKAEERFYKWEEERRREEREHELRIIQLLLDHSRSSMIQTPQTPDYLRSLHNHNTHIFTPSPSNN